jgi:polyisoprenoid-binding protein YceI
LDPSSGQLDRVVNHVLVPVAGSYELDPVHTFVTFRAQHVTVGRVRGRFESVTGTAIIAEEPTASSVGAEIAAASISTLMSIRDDDLRSDRYLDVEQFPTITYRSSSVAEEPKGNWLVGGDLIDIDAELIRPL